MFQVDKEALIRENIAFIREIFFILPTKMSSMGFRTLRFKLYKLILLHDKIFQDERQNTQERTKKMMINGL